jgi:hypothetical protein
MEGVTKLDCVRYDLALCVHLHEFEAPVEIKSGPNVEAVFGTEVPGSAHAWLGVDEDQQPTGARGVLLKLKGPLKNSQAEIFGLMADCRC